MRRPAKSTQSGAPEPAAPIAAMKHFMGHRKPSGGFTLRPLPPFRLDLTAWALRRRSRNLIDRWDGTTYRRVIALGGRPTELAVRQAGSSAAPTLRVTATPPPQTLPERRRVRSIVDRLLGLRIDLTDWYRMAAGDARLRPLADTFRGMKPPRFPTMFEAVVNAFACQQLSLEVGLELLNRLATISSARLGRRGDVRYAFPTAQDIARLPPEKYPSDRVQPSESPRASRSCETDHTTGAGAGVHRERERRSGPTAPTRIARRRPVDCRVRAATRARTPARIPWR